MPQSYNSDFPELHNDSGTDHDHRRQNTKLFAASTTEIFDKTPLFRSNSSLLSSHSSSLGSSSGTISSYNSCSSATINSTSSSSSGRPSTVTMEATHGKEPGSENNPIEHRARRVSLRSDARFSEYLSSTSSWDCEWEDELPEMKDPSDFPHRRLSNCKTPGFRVPSSTPSCTSRDEKCRSSLSSGYFSELEVTTSTLMDNDSVDNSPVYPPFPDPLAPPLIPMRQTPYQRSKDVDDDEEREQQPSTSRFAAAGILRASCPTLNTMDSSRMLLPVNDDFRRKLRARHADDFSDMSASTVDIGPTKKEELKAKPSTAKKIVTSKSSGCLASGNVRGLNMMFLNRPITLRFTPSGLTESHRVVWVSEGGNHPGIVKWVGKIRGNLYAGVEFEKAIGNSSGIYGYGHGLQTRLFTCKLGYGRFIPVDQLILYEDFYENQKTGFICIICRDDFIEPGNNEDLNLPEKIMVATKCGHLFHHKCLNQWFNEKTAAVQQCPYCQSPVDRNDTIRIFPAQLK